MSREVGCFVSVNIIALSFHCYTTITQNSKHNKCNAINRRDGVVVGASSSHSADLGFNPLVESYQKTLKMVSIAFLLIVRHLRKVVENKPASSLVVSLGKALNGTPHLFVEDR